MSPSVDAVIQTLIIWDQGSSSPPCLRLKDAGLHSESLQVKTSTEQLGYGGGSHSTLDRDVGVLFLYETVWFLR